MSSGSTTTWVLATVAVAGGVFIAVQQMKPKDQEITLDVPSIEVPLIEIKKPPIAEIVRIENGIATIAGAGTPDEEIIIMDGDKEVARTNIGSDGTFALVFDYDVPENGAVLDINSEDSSGDRLTADAPIAIVPKTADETLVASLDDNAIKVEVNNKEQLNFAGAVYGSAKDATLSGSTTPNTTVELVLNGGKLTSFSSGETGSWEYTVADLPVGKHKLEILTSDDQVLTVDLERAPIIETAKITRGDTLWRIAEKAYGDGFRYVDIYNMNAELITDPNLIYPDQQIKIEKK